MSSSYSQQQLSQQQLAAVVKLIRTAQDLEQNENEAEAYRYYLTAVQHLTSFLALCTPVNGELTAAANVSPAKVNQLYAMCKQCLERAESLFDNSVKEKRSFKSSHPPPLNPAASVPEMSPPNRYQMKTRSVSEINNSPRSHSKNSPYELKTAKSPQQCSNINPLHKLSPMEIAKKKNFYLMEQYKASLKNNPTASLRSSQNLSLEYLRRMEENLSIARITEQTMTRKLREREHRLQETVQKQKSMDSLTMDELKEEVASFEAHQTKLNSIKQRLLNNPTDATDIVNLIHSVLNMVDHPLCKLFGEHQYSIVQLLQPMIKEVEKVELPKLIIEIAKPKVSCVSDVHNSPSQSPSQISPKSLSQSPSQISPKSLSHTFQDSSDIKLAKMKQELMGGDIFNEYDSDDDEFKTLPHFEPPENDQLKQEVKQEMKVEEEEFHSLVPLTCTMLLGNSSVIDLLARNYQPKLNSAVKLIHSAIDKLVNSFVHIYIVVSEENVDICRTALEAIFFPPIWPLLHTVYRCVSYRDECLVANNMYKYVNATPRDITVRKKFWLTNQDTPPYSEAINQLKTLSQLRCPSAKLDRLVTLSKCIVQSIEDYYKDTDKDIAVGVDDILPIMTYVILRTGLPQLVSECSIIQEFIQDSYMIGEEGFCLTTFDTALKYVKVMDS